MYNTFPSPSSELFDLQQLDALELFLPLFSLLKSHLLPFQESKSSFFALLV